jgi:hypothetical protein
MPDKHDFKELSQSYSCLETLIRKMKISAVRDQEGKTWFDTNHRWGISLNEAEEQALLDLGIQIQIR